MIVLPYIETFIFNGVQILDLGWFFRSHKIVWYVTRRVLGVTASYLAQIELINLDREYWEVGIPVNQPEDRIIAWKKAQELRHNKETGMFVPNFKTEKDENGVERYFVRRKRQHTFVNDWLRDAIQNKTLGLGKINDRGKY